MEQKNWDLSRRAYEAGELGFCGRNMALDEVLEAPKYLYNKIRILESIFMKKWIPNKEKVPGVPGTFCVYDFLLYIPI